MNVMERWASEQSKMMTKLQGNMSLIQEALLELKEKVKRSQESGQEVREQRKLGERGRKEGKKYQIGNQHGRGGRKVQSMD